MATELLHISTSTATVWPGVFDLDIVIDMMDGTGPQQVDFTWRSGDTDSICPQIEAFLNERPDFPLLPYVPVAPSTNPVDYPLTMRQLRIGLVVNGFDVNIIKTVIDAIADPMQRAIATIWYEESSTVFWDHPMTQALMGLLGVPEANRVAMWMGAKDIVA